MHRSMINGLCIFIFLVLFSLLPACSPSQSDSSTKVQTVTVREAEQALNQFLPDDANLILPLRPKYQQKIQLKDLDGDKTNEVIALYRREKKEKYVYLIILKKAGKRWTVLEKRSEKAEVLKQFILEDVTGDKVSDLVMEINNPSHGELIIFNCKDGVEIERLKGGSRGLLDKFSSADVVREHLNVIIADLNNDHTSEIIQLTYDEEEERSLATLYQIRDNELVVQQQVEIGLEPMILYAETLVGKIDQTRKGVVITSVQGAHASSTIILTLEEGQLVDLFQERQSQFNKLANTHFAGAEDFDGDGIIEINSLENTSISEDLPEAQKHFTSNWYQITEDNQLILDGKSNDNLFSENSRFIFPKKWLHEKILAVRSPEALEDGKEYDFTSTNYYLDGYRFPLLTITAYRNDIWQKEKTRLTHEKIPFTILNDQYNKTYVAVFPKEEEIRKYPVIVEFIPTQEEVKSLFKVMVRESLE